MSDVLIVQSGREERNIKRDGQVSASVQDHGRLSTLKDRVTAVLAEGTADIKACTQGRANPALVQKDKNEMHASEGLYGEEVIKPLHSDASEAC